MAASARSLQLGPAKLVTLALALSVACAAAEEPEDDGPSSPIGGSSATAGSGGAAAGTSGASSSTAGKPPTGTAGTPPTGTAGAGTGATSGVGGTPGGTAGTPAGTAGTPAGTAGTGTGTCPQYTGTLATDSLIFSAGFGKSTVGMWSGYGYTYTYGTATVTPGMGNACFAGAKFCANGAVPASDASGAGLGWNIAQMQGATTKAAVAIAGSVKLSFTGVTAGMRVQLSLPATPPATPVSYCYTLTAADVATVTIPAASFKTECWGTAGKAYAGEPVEAIQIAVPGSTAGTAKTFDICVTDIEPG